MKQLIKTIIVDDSDKSRNVLTKLLNQEFPNVDIVGEADNITSAYNYIIEEMPDLVFLDIEMPNGNGFDLLKKFEQVPFQVIFVTAYDHYAIKAIKCSALDYILKPVDIAELRKSVKKIIINNDHASLQSQINLLREEVNNPKSINKVAINTKDGIEFLPASDIIQLKADGSYTEIYLTDSKKFVASKSLKEFEFLIEKNNFFRSHRSHIINLDHLIKYIPTDNIIYLSGNQVSGVSRNQKEHLNALIRSMGK